MSLLDYWTEVELKAKVITESFLSLGGYDAGVPVSPGVWDKNYFPNPCESYYNVTSETSPSPSCGERQCYEGSVNIVNAIHGHSGVFDEPSAYKDASINYTKGLRMHLDFSEALAQVRTWYGADKGIIAKANPYEEQSLSFNFGGLTGDLNKDEEESTAPFIFNHGLQAAYNEEGSATLHLSPNAATGGVAEGKIAFEAYMKCPSSGGLTYWGPESSDDYNVKVRLWTVNNCLTVFLMSVMEVGIVWQQVNPDPAQEIDKDSNIPPDDASQSNSGGEGGSGGTGGTRTYEDSEGNSYIPGERYVSWEDTTDFDSVFIPADVDLDEQSGIVVGTDILAGQGSLLNNGVYIETIKQSLVDIDEMTFVQSTKYDETALFGVGQKVFGLVKGVTKFIGFVDDISRNLDPNEQYIRYHASGLKNRLYNLPFAYVYRFENIYLHDAFKKVIDTIPSAIVSWCDITKLPKDILLPSLDLSSCSLGRALDTLLDFAGRYGYYIDHTYKLTVYDLKNLPVSKNITVATEGERLSNHPEYIVHKQNLNINTSQCKTRCIIKGDYPEIETIEDVIPEYEERDVFYPATGVEGTSIYMKFQVHRNILNVISVVGKTVYEWSGFGRTYYEKVFDVEVLHIDHVAGIVWCKWHGKQASYRIQYTYKDDNPIMVDTGWKGTAYTKYGIKQVIIKDDTRFKKTNVDGLDRDDTDIMLDYANQLLEKYKDAEIGGSIVCDNLQTSFVVGSKFNILGTKEDWSNINAAMISVTYNIPDKTTIIELTNSYQLWSGLPDYRLLIREYEYEEKRKEDEYTRRQRDLKDIVRGPSVRW